MLGGLLRILLGYVAACAIGAILVLVSLWSLDPNPSDSVATIPFFFLIATLVVGAIAAAPALILIVLAEVFGWRSRIVYILNGAGIGLVSYVIVSLPEIWNYYYISLMVSFPPAGAAAGLVYWWIAGRNAGGLRGKQDRSSTQGAAL